jgi:hypothetical protein
MWLIKVKTNAKIQSQPLKERELIEIININDFFGVGGIYEEVFGFRFINFYDSIRRVWSGNK